MVRQGSFAALVGVAVAWASAALAAGPIGQPLKLGAQPGRSIDDPFLSETMRSDARLNAVCFVDADTGWAVGDRGVIWHTQDGGQQWRLQESGVGCTLRTVAFVDRRHGWAAGGDYQPYTHLGSATILKTVDGGRTWSRIPQLEMLPAVRKVRFADRERGWALCDASAMFASGVFTTDNGGRSWTPMPGGVSAGWRSGDLLDPQNGALGGTAGRTAVVRNGGIRLGRSPQFGLRGVCDIRLLPPVYGWLVGDGGLVMMTGDGGASWQNPPGELPEEVSRQFDFAAMSVVGPHCWIAGSPGSRILHSPDAGRSWEMLSTGHNLPIYDITFVDERHGCAVGALGTILVTDDGGQGWHRSRAGGRRAAVLGFFCRSQRVPWELFGRLSANDGYLGVVEVVGREDLYAPDSAHGLPADRIHQAAIALGLSDTRLAWRFPMREAVLRLDSDRTTELWDRANDGRGLAALRDELVRQIRIWQPEVIVFPESDPTGESPEAQTLSRLVLEAVQHAADPTSMVEQTTHAELRPWQVSRAFSFAQSGRRGPIELATAQLAQRLGRSLADLAVEPRGLIEQRFAPGPATLGFRLCFDQTDAQEEVDDFFDGLVLSPGGGARRMPLEISAEGADLLQRMARRARNTRAILAQTENDQQNGARLAAQTADLTQGLDPKAAAQVLHHLAARLERSGQRSLAAEMHGLLIERYPDSGFAASSAAWLVKYFGSGEEAWRIQGRQRYAVAQASTLAIESSSKEDRLKRAADLGDYLERRRPELYAEPGLRFPLAVVARRRGYPRDAERFYLAQRHRPGEGAWTQAAEVEQWMTEPEGEPPKSSLRCVFAPAKPRLDGRLDDAVWKKARPVTLHSPGADDAAWPAEIRAAYDDEFLYFAIRCHCAAGSNYEPDESPRPRDADLSAHDRIDILIDLDRDYATYYRLTIDHRGFTSEGCWGDRTWDPTWFVAFAGEDGSWQTEAAIPLDQLTGDYPRSRSVWALGVQRVVPGVGFQSWTVPASVRVRPEGFGLLIFE